MGEPIPKNRKAEAPPPAETRPAEPEPAAVAIPAEVLPAEQERPAALPAPAAARVAFLRAFSAAKSEFETITKTRPIYADKNWRDILARGGTPKVSRYYADLTDVMNCTDAALLRHGLYHRIDSEVTEDSGLRYTVIMAHVDGHVETGIYELSADDIRPGEGALVSKLSPIQMRGIVDTYARRYALQHFLGVAAEADHDGQVDQGPAGDPKAAAIFAGSAGAADPAPAADPKAAAIFSGSPNGAVEPAPAAAEPEPDPPAATPEPALTTEPGAAEPVERTLSAAKQELTDLLGDRLTEAGIEDSTGNILAMVDKACALVGVTRADLTDVGTVESVIALQQVSPTDPAFLRETA